MAVKANRLSKLIKVFAWVSLAAAFILGQIANQPDYDALLNNAYPGVTLKQDTELSGDLALYHWAASDGQPQRWVVLGEAQGYGGPLTIAATVSQPDSIPKVDEVRLIAHTETPPYVERLVKKQFFRQMNDAPISSDFLLGEDIDGYSGATVTARAVSQALREVTHSLAVLEFNMEPSWTNDPWVFGWQELGMLILVGIAFALTLRSNNRLLNSLKVALPLLSLVFVGFYTNASLSVGNFAGMILGYVPGIKQHPIWWILMGSILIGILFMGRNMYCNKLCPYSAVQSMLHKVTGLKMKVPQWLNKQGHSIILMMIWASFMLIFLSGHPALGTYEPFSMMFALEGTGLQWYILPLSLFGACFVPDFWCRYFCPVGLIINESVKVRRKTLNKFKQRFSQ
ncbi:FMN-binding protein [Ferrimonas balearica]|uniref:FMN-binding protein n=1 Tax=Ferrimonas balearica TaxID=44012 RepID=UPI001C582CAD|nr:FMN-binding protein [Ferrimonas balearica]MBW3141505.1 FMN-binding protein [Ferrimonas balearica]MBY6019737.1 FMN-binding protein [Halomonas denitrificans]MBY6096803.1 FMN-binding protein [Ferrimonas balearica]